MNVVVNVQEACRVLERWAKDEKARVEKSITGSLYDAAYFLYSNAWRDLKSGALGLRERQVLRRIGAVRREIKQRQTPGVRLRGGKTSTHPLAPLYRGILYRVQKSEKKASVGFMASEMGFGSVTYRRDGSSKPGLARWAEQLAGMHRVGYRLEYSEEMRKKLHKMGVHLLKSTTGANVPPRDIIGAVADRYGARAMQKLTESFDAKMRGERT